LTVRSSLAIERRWLQAVADTALVAMAWWMAFWFRFNLEIPEEFLNQALQTLAWPLAGFAMGLAAVGVYRQIWRYTSVEELRTLVYGMVLSALMTAAGVLMMRYPNFPRSVLLLHPLLTLLLLGAARAGWRMLFEQTHQIRPGAKPLLIIGSVSEAAGALRALKGSTEWAPMAIVSPNPGDLGRSLQGIPVLGTLDKLADVAERVSAQLALVAAPAGSASRREALSHAVDAKVSLLTMPRPDEWLRAEAPGPRRVELEDLLGRATVDLDTQGLSELFAGQTVMVTGAGGSIGSELCRQIARFGVSRMILVDVSEYGIYQLEQEVRENHPQMQGLYFTANVRDCDRLDAIARRYKPAVVFHAAAYKHVPLMEDLNEIEAVRTNILGTLHAAQTAGKCGARRFVLISTDKAVNPTNVMGASKRLAERVVQAVAAEYPQTQFVSVRFGNVLGSSGSVVPLFEQQIAKGGPVTVTHPDIVRYFMTIPEAARLVLQAGLMGKSGQIFVLDMGEPVKIVDLARMMIRLSGKTEQEIPIAFSGLRPGEKLFEELLANDETTEPTPHPKLRIAKANGNGGTATVLSIDEVLEWVQSAGPAPDSAAVRHWLRQHVPEYQAQGIS
jgi:FlaA1/EpsC-like NDP-sugar epimerase